jgi:prepilin-type N-terminal cleavage/methylation domain-containing protein
MFRNRKPSGFTLVEILIVVVIMAILAATIIPQFSDSTTDAKVSNSKFNLHTLRAQIETYRAQHNYISPSADLSELLVRTNAAGVKMPAAGNPADYPYGPYLRALPANPFTNSITVKSITNDPAAAGDVSTTHGWLYNSTTGGVWINHDKHYID